MADQPPTPPTTQDFPDHWGFYLLQAINRLDDKIDQVSREQQRTADALRQEIGGVRQEIGGIDSLGNRSKERSYAMRILDGSIALSACTSALLDYARCMGGHLTQGDLALQLGRERSGITHMLAGRLRIPADQLLRWLVLCHMPEPQQAAGYWSELGRATVRASYLPILPERLSESAGPTDTTTAAVALCREALSRAQSTSDEAARVVAWWNGSVALLALVQAVVGLSPLDTLADLAGSPIPRLLYQATTHHLTSAGRLATAGLWWSLVYAEAIVPTSKVSEPPLCMLPICRPILDGSATDPQFPTVVREAWQQTLALVRATPIWPAPADPLSDSASTDPDDWLQMSQVWARLTKADQARLVDLAQRLARPR